MKENRNKKGYLDINDYKIINRQKTGHSPNLWLIHDRQEYFFKSIEQLKRYKELFYSTLLYNNKINTVSYDLAIFQNDLGVISPKYYTGTGKCVTLGHIIDFYQKNHYCYSSNLYNVRKIREILKWLCLKFGFNYSEQLDYEILQKFIIQILIANKDMHGSNIEFFIDDTIHFSPFYDFEYCGELDFNNFYPTGNCYKIDYSDENCKNYP